MPNKSYPFQIAIDGNEANVNHRVGSNVYAYELLRHLENLTQNNQQFSFTILLSQSPIADLPKERINWQYQIIKPSFLWTQWALPLHLYLNKNLYQLFFTPGHYAPRFCPIPYISSIMDLAFLKYPQQFKISDLFQLKNWTKYSVETAHKIITISQFTKSEIIKYYHQNPDDIEVLYPSVSFSENRSLISKEKAFFNKYQINGPYFLSVATIQPRKNLIQLIEAFEEFSRSLAAGKIKISKNKKNQGSPKLVLAGKIGWLADNIINRIEQSSFKKRIILPGFVPDEYKIALYQKSIATFLLSPYEGFGIPALEALHCQSVPVVVNSSSLPEVIGNAGIKINLNQVNLVNAMIQVYTLKARQKAIFRKLAREQIKQFSWMKNSQKLLNIFQDFIN